MKDHNDYREIKEICFAAEKTEVSLFFCDGSYWVKVIRHDPKDAQFSGCFSFSAQLNAEVYFNEYVRNAHYCR